MLISPTVQLRRTRAAADALVTALREHDVEGVVLLRAVAVARLLRGRLDSRRFDDAEQFAQEIDRALVRVRLLCVAHRLHAFRPVRRALTAFSVAERAVVEE
jgi:hypothetical protein